MKLERRVLRRARIEIIPMIDTILMLLIFYMSFSTFARREKRFSTKLPTVGAATAPTQVPLDILLHVKDRNIILVNNSASYDVDGLRDAMAQLSAVGQDTTIVIEAEPDTSYQDIVSILDACAQAHLSKVALRPLSGKMASSR
ncbi:MAG TPA: biopolymer transporter ExbD [Verrucomicrobiae bacterium]|nr:biopolymer transporter ExbD [Verrucomicrobiae bacterium]